MDRNLLEIMRSALEPRLGGGGPNHKDDEEWGGEASNVSVSDDKCVRIAGGERGQDQGLYFRICVFLSSLASKTLGFSGLVCWIQSLTLKDVVVSDISMFGLRVGKFKVWGCPSFECYVSRKCGLEEDARYVQHKAM